MSEGVLFWNDRIMNVSEQIAMRAVDIIEDGRVLSSIQT